jgi:hypothetical protein
MDDQIVQPAIAGYDEFGIQLFYSEYIPMKYSEVQRCLEILLAVHKDKNTSRVCIDFAL